MKKILLLGAAAFQLPPIEYAKKTGYYTITCDNRPNNPGHSLSDKSYIVSTIDKNKILKIAQKEKIDGLLTFGSDVSAPTVAYVCEKLNLPGNSVKTIELLTKKNLFRKFLGSIKIQETKFETFTQKELLSAKDYIINNKLPLVVKPVDSAGSKGVSIIENISNIEKKLHYAYRESFKKEIIIENYCVKYGKQICGDGYFENGKIKYIFFGDGHFYDNGKNLAPWGETFPSTHNDKSLIKARNTIEIILKKSGFIKGHFNHDLLIDENGDCFIIEIGPRGGGNFIPKVIFLKYGVDLVADSVEAALNKDFKSLQYVNESDLFFSSYMVHSKRLSGIYQQFKIDAKFKKYILLINNYLMKGETVYPFIKGSYAIANLVLKFDSFDEMNFIYSNNIYKYFKIYFNEQDSNI